MEPNPISNTLVETIHETKTSPIVIVSSSLQGYPLLDSHRLGQVPREVDVQTRTDGQPVGNQLQRNDVQQTLQAVDRLRHFDLLRLRSRELRVILVANDNWPTATSND